MVLKIKGGDRNGFIKPVLSTDRDVLHHQCHHGYFYFTLHLQCQLSLGAAGFMSVGAYVGAMLSLKAELPIVVGILVGGLVCKSCSSYHLAYQQQDLKACTWLFQPLVLVK